MTYDFFKKSKIHTSPKLIRERLGMKVWIKALILLFRAPFIGSGWAKGANFFYFGLLKVGIAQCGPRGAGAPLQVVCIPKKRKKSVRNLNAEDN